MNTPEKALYTLLLAAGPVTALLDERLYAGSRPEADPLPAAVHSVISDVRLSPRPVKPNGGTHPWRARIQLTCFGASAEDAKTLAEAAMAACVDQSGAFGGVTVEDIAAERGADSFDQVVQTYAQPVDFLITYSR